MKKFLIALFLLITFVTVLIVPNSSYAVSNKIVLHIEGMICIA